jgi:hypothetical protein
MDRLRTFLVGGALTALATIALALPATAADTEGTLAFVNGIPGKRVDVCLNGKEIKSNLPYGGKVFKDVVGVGQKTLKFTERDPRTCRGRQVAQDSFYLDNGNDVTIVVTKSAPLRVVYFYNQEPFLGEIPPLGAPSGASFLTWRNASAMAVNFRIRFYAPTPENGSVVPNADALYAKGQQFRGDTDTEVGYILQVRARLPEAVDTLAVLRSELVASHRHEWILVGSNPGNARFVFLDRVVSQPSP